MSSLFFQILLNIKLQLFNQINLGAGGLERPICGELEPSHGRGNFAHCRHSNGHETTKSIERTDMVSKRVGAGAGTRTTTRPGSRGVIRRRDSRIYMYQPSFNLPYC